MGMTIEDCIKKLLINNEDDTYVLGNETIDFAIDTMRKYQKIEQILDDCDLEAWEVLEKVKKVVEDGND